MGAAVAGERLPIPAAPPLTQPHPGELGHQIELGRPHVAERCRRPLEVAVDEVEVMRRDDLRGHVVLVDPPMRLAPVEDAERLAGRQPLEIGDQDLDHEAATRLQVRGDVPEAGDLRSLRRQVHDRVEHDVGQRERPPDPRGRHVTDRHVDTLGPRLLSQPGHHGARELDPVDRDATLGEWQRDPAGPDAQLERFPLACERSQEVDDRRDDRRRCDRCHVVVVPRGGPLIEVPVSVRHGRESTRCIACVDTRAVEA